MNLALFDIDRTLIGIDSDSSWNDFLFRKGLLESEQYQAKNLYFLQQYQQGELNIHEYLQFALAPFARYSKAQLQQWHEQFMQEIIRPSMRPKAIESIRQHIGAGDLCACVTSTNTFVATPISYAFGISNVLGSDLEEQNGQWTGRPTGIPCFREGKVTRVSDWLTARASTLSSFDTTYFYSDSINDLPLLSVVTQPVAVSPDERLREIALRRGWSIVDWSASNEF